MQKCDSLATNFFKESSMNILIKNSRNFLVVTTVLFGVYAMMGDVYAQQSNDKSKAVDKSISVDKNKPARSQSEKKDGEMILEVPVVLQPRMRIRRRGR